MADTLLLRLPRTAEQVASWLIVDAAGAPLASPESGPLELAAARGAGRRVCVVVSGTDVTLAEPEIPVKAGAKLQQLVPYALEEHLADDIDDLQFAIGKRVGDSPRIPTAVVTRALLDEWLAKLRSAAIEPDAIYADSDLLPVNPGHAVALLEEDAVSVRPPHGPAITLPTELIGDALEMSQAAPDPSGGTRGLLLYTDLATWERHSPEVEAARVRFDGLKVQLLSAGPLALFAQQLPTGAPINLLQGAYAPKTRAEGLKAWRLAAMLLGALVALHVVGKVTELTLLKHRERQVDASIRDTFHKAMPGDPNTLDARHRMEQRLLAARGVGGGLLPALQALAQARDAAPGTSLQTLSFKQGSLELKLSAPDAASLERVSQSMRSSGWHADLIGGDNTASGYEGRLQVRPSGS